LQNSQKSGNPWSLFLAKQGNASQLQAFVLTYPPYQGENKLSSEEKPLPIMQFGSSKDEKRIKEYPTCHQIV
jgi:hypothetical protein